MLLVTIISCIVAVNEACVDGVPLGGGCSSWAVGSEDAVSPAAKGPT